jgi:chromosome partitioning protein
VRTLAVSLFKGGVGKTTLAVNLAAGLADAGQRVLLIDADPQAGTSRHLNVQTSEHSTLADVLARRATLLDAARPLDAVPGLFVVPSELALARADRELREPRRLRDLIAGLPRGRFDLVLIDTPPGWGSLTVAALAAARDVIAPAEPKTLSLAALADLVAMIEDIRGDLNPSLRLLGVVPSRVQRTRLAGEGIEDLHQHFRDKVLPEIRESARVAEAPGFGLPVSRYAPGSIGAEDFAALAAKVLERLNA